MAVEWWRMRPPVERVGRENRLREKTERAGCCTQGAAKRSRPPSWARTDGTRQDAKPRHKHLEYVCAAREEEGELLLRELKEFTQLRGLRLGECTLTLPHNGASTCLPARDEVC